MLHFPVSEYQHTTSFVTCDPSSESNEEVKVSILILIEKRKENKTQITKRSAIRRKKRGNALRRENYFHFTSLTGFSALGQTNHPPLVWARPSKIIFFAYDQLGKFREATALPG